MATEQTDTIQATGGSPDYTSIANWEAGTDNDLVTADEVRIGQITSSENYNESVTIAGATVDATRYRKLTVSDGNWHEGTFSTSKARMKGNPSGRFLTIAEDYFMVERLQFDHAGESPDTSDECIRINSRIDNTVISRCIMRGDATTNDCDGVYTSHDTTDETWTVNVDNCLIYDFARAGITVQAFNAAHTGDVTVNVDHCTIAQVGESGEADGGGIDTLGNSAAGGTTATINVYNTIVTLQTSSGSACYQATGIEEGTDYNTTWNGTHNGAEDASLTTVGLTTGAQESLTEANIFTAPGSDDYTPATGEALEDNGTNRQGSEPDSRQDFSLDIAEDARGTTGVEIGCYAIAAAGGGLGIPIAYHHYRTMHSA